VGGSTPVGALLSRLILDINSQKKEVVTGYHNCTICE